MERIWSPQEEADRLKERFAKSGVKKSEFAGKFKVPGGASMLSQQITGTRPLNLESAIAYAKGFGVSLEEISPRLAKQAREALGFPSNTRAANLQLENMSAATMEIVAMLDGLSERQLNILAWEIGKILPTLKASPSATVEKSDEANDESVRIKYQIRNKQTGT